MRTARPLSEVPLVAVTAMVSVPSAMRSLVMLKSLRAVAEEVMVLAGMVTVISLPAAGAVKSAASAVGFKSASVSLKTKVTTEAAPICEESVAEGKAAVIVASPALPSPSSAVVSPKARMISESSSAMVRAVSDTG